LFERLNISYWREGFGGIIEINLLEKSKATYIINLQYKLDEINFKVFIKYFNM